MKKLLLIICGMLFVSVTAVQAQSDTSRLRTNRQQQDMNKQQDPTKQKSTQGQSQYRRDQSGTQGQYQTDTTGRPTMNRQQHPQSAQDSTGIQSSQGSQNFRRDTTGASPAQLRRDNPTGTNGTTGTSGTTGGPTRKKNRGDQ